MENEFLGQNSAYSRSSVIFYIFSAKKVARVAKNKKMKDLWLRLKIYKGFSENILIKCSELAFCRCSIVPPNNVLINFSK